MPPHIFALTNNAYKRGVLKANSLNQCLIIGGESGSGKTFTTKLALEFLANISNSSNENLCLAQQVINAIPVLEGN